MLGVESQMSMENKNLDWASQAGCTEPRYLQTSFFEQAVVQQCPASASVVVQGMYFSSLSVYRLVQRSSMLFQVSMGFVDDVILWHRCGCTNPCKLFQGCVGFGPTLVWAGWGKGLLVERLRGFCSA